MGPPDLERADGGHPGRRAIGQVARFEETARTLWRSDLERPEKKRRLKEVRASIVRHIERLDAQRGENEGDAWRMRCFDRVRGYLTHLAADVEELALACEQAPAAA